LEDVLGRRINTIHIVGGGSRNELLNQMTADATAGGWWPAPPRPPRSVTSSSRRWPTGDIKSLADARAVVRDSFEVKVYEPQQAKAWDEAYARFHAVLRTKYGPPWRTREE
jgi:sugar (pentulose or hexulose) kinase